MVLEPGERRLVPTGVSIALPDGFVALIHPRSGLATKHGLTVVNAPGTVDAGYRGEIAVTLLNTDRDKAIELRRGDRIAQMVIQRVEYAQFVAVEELSDSVRGDGGFGSTGGFAAPQAWPPGSCRLRRTAGYGRQLHDCTGGCPGRHGGHKITTKETTPWFLGVAGKPRRTRQQSPGKPRRLQTPTADCRDRQPARGRGATGPFDVSEIDSTRTATWTSARS